MSTPHHNTYSRVEEHLHKATAETAAYTTTDAINHTRSAAAAPAFYISHTFRRKFMWGILGVLGMSTVAFYSFWQQATVQSPVPHVGSRQPIAQQQSSLQNTKVAPPTAQTQQQSRVSVDTVRGRPALQELLNTKNTLKSNDVNGTGTIQLTSSSAPKITTDSVRAVTVSVLSTTGNRNDTIPLVNVYEPDDATLRKLGFYRYANDSVVRHTPILTPWIKDLCRTLLLPNGRSRSSFVLSKDVPPLPLATNHELYTANSNGRIQMFYNEVLGYTRSSALKDYLVARGETEILEQIHTEEEKSKAEGMRSEITFKVDTAYGSDKPRTLRSILHKSTQSFVNDVQSIEVSATQQDQRDMLEQYVQTVSTLRQKYRDSCVVVRVRCGDSGIFHFLYRPTPEFLAQLPHKAALQIRAELGNREALEELRRSYKGCTFMSFCRSAEGAVLQSSIMGSTSDNLRLAFTLSQQRTVRIALYTLGGGLAAEIDPGTVYAGGDHVVPLRVRSESDGFYFLTLTTSDGEKITHRVVIDK